MPGNFRPNRAAGTLVAFAFFEVTAQRGIGTMLAMIVVDRLVHRIDVRAIMATGFALTAFSLYQMTGITLQMDSSLIVSSGFIQGELLWAPRVHAAPSDFTAPRTPARSRNRPAWRCCPR